MRTPPKLRGQSLHSLAVWATTATSRNPTAGDGYAPAAKCEAKMEMPQQPDGEVLADNCEAKMEMAQQRTAKLKI